MKKTQHRPAKKLGLAESHLHHHTKALSVILYGKLTLCNFEIANVLSQGENKYTQGYQQ